MEKKRLLIVTQKVDQNDSVLGFFYGWIKEFSKHWQSITVICLEKGEYALPKNVSVFSLGKENRASKLKKVFKFLFLIFSLRKKYDSIFVHMNQEYVLLGGFFWRMSGKKIFLWRNHAKGNLLTQLAIFLSNKVFYTSSKSFTARFKKSEIMPVGINTEFFKPDPAVKKNSQSILFLGRLSAVKHPDIFIYALLELQKKDIHFTATIVGSVASEEEKSYADNLYKIADSLVRKEKLFFVSSVPNSETPDIYRKHGIYVNLTRAGSMDKTIFEAMACGTIPLVHNSFFKGVLEDDLMVEKLDSHLLANKLADLLKSGKNYGNLRNFVVNNHSLTHLASLLHENTSR